MAKADKATVVKRTNEVLKLLLAGAEFEDIRQYSADKGWDIRDRQLRRYQEIAYQRLAEATKHDEQQLLGRHLMQRRALYARALKGNDIRTALLVLKDEAALEGIYPPTKIAPTTPDGRYPYQGRLSREERFFRMLSAQGRNDQSELELLEQLTPYAYYRMPDTTQPQLVLSLCSVEYVAQQLDRAGMVLMALWRLSQEDPAQEVWDQIGMSQAYLFKVERDGWHEFTQTIGVDPNELVRANHEGLLLDTYGDQFYNLAPTENEFAQLAASLGLSLNQIPTAKGVAKYWRRILDESLRK